MTCCTCCWPVPTFRQDGRQHGHAQPEQYLLVPHIDLGVDVADHELGVAGQHHQEVGVGAEAGDVEVGQRDKGGRVVGEGSLTQASSPWPHWGSLTLLNIITILIIIKIIVIIILIFIIFHHDSLPARCGAVTLYKVSQAKDQVRLGTLCIAEKPSWAWPDRWRLETRPWPSLS